MEITRSVSVTRGEAIMEKYNRFFVYFSVVIKEM